MRVLLADQLAVLELTSPLGGGGEAQVFAAPGGKVAKIFHADAKSREQKLVFMIANPIWDPPSRTGHRRFCWPEEAILDSTNREFLGYLMHKANGVPMGTIVNPASRPSYADFDFRLRSALHFAEAVAVLHADDIVVGDINESNAFIDDESLVTLIDLDSAQIARDAQMRCPVGTPEFTPPELMRRPLDAVDREAHHDGFGIAVLVHKLLLGTHPFAGVWAGAGRLSLIDAIERGMWPDRDGGNAEYLPSRQQNPPFARLPESLRRLFARAFVAGHHWPPDRPAASEWVAVLKALVNNTAPLPAAPAPPAAKAASAFRPYLAALASLSAAALAALKKRKKLAFATAALLLAATAFGAAWACWPGGKTPPAATPTNAQRPSYTPLIDALLREDQERQQRQRDDARMRRVEPKPERPRPSYTPLIDRLLLEDDLRHGR